MRDDTTSHAGALRRARGATRYLLWRWHRVRATAPTDKAPRRTSRIRARSSASSSFASFAQLRETGSTDVYNVREQTTLSPLWLRVQGDLLYGPQSTPRAATPPLTGGARCSRTYRHIPPRQVCSDQACTASPLSEACAATMCIGGIIASRCRRKVLLSSGLVKRSEMCGGSAST